MVDIPRDTCACTKHTGPHWLYTDYIIFEMNLKLLERCALHIQSLYEIYLQPEKTQQDLREAFIQKNAALSSFRAFAMEELTRLQQKIWNMHVEQRERISYAVLGENFKPLEDHERELRKKIKDMSLAMVPVT
jgi:hypothetical protein